jgi:hypothetical protein
MCVWHLSCDISRERLRSLLERGSIKVPIGRYFLVIGSILFAMLFIAERYWPAATSPTFPEARFDRSIIRVQSAHRWPERIVFDTSLPTLVPLPVAVATEAPIIARPPLKAFAQIPMSKVTGSTSSVKRKRRFVKHNANTNIAAYHPPEALPPGW